MIEVSLASLQVARMIIVVAIAFIVSWSPFYLVTLVSQLQPDSFLRRSNFVFTMLTIHLAGFTSSAVNPLIYHFMSDKFRKSFRHIICTVLCWCVSPAHRPSGVQSDWGSGSERGDGEGGSSGNDSSQGVTQWPHMPFSSFRSSLRQGWRKRHSQHQPATPESIRLNRMDTRLLDNNCSLKTTPKTVRCILKKSSGNTVSRIERCSPGHASPVSPTNKHFRFVTPDEPKNTETTRLLNEVRRDASVYDVVYNDTKKPDRFVKGDKQTNHHLVMPVTEEDQQRDTSVIDVHSDTSVIDVHKEPFNSSSSELVDSTGSGLTETSCQCNSLVRSRSASDELGENQGDSLSVFYRSFSGSKEAEKSHTLQAETANVVLPPRQAPDMTSVSSDQLGRALLPVVGVTNGSAGATNGIHRIQFPGAKDLPLHMWLEPQCQS